MVPEQQLWALGYQGAVIALTEDYLSNRHIAKSPNRTLCGKPIKKSKLQYNNGGKFLGYAQDSFTSVYGFYGSGRCKDCLTRYLKHRLSPEGEKLMRKYRARIALRLPIRVPGGYSKH